jgi:hypothetical protein
MNMKKNILKLILSFLFLAVVILMSGCDVQHFLSQGTTIGNLEGTVLIGPLCPVETVPPDPACLPTAETYKAYPVGIWTADGKQKVRTIEPKLDGRYDVSLPEGFYLVDRENTQAGIGSNLPQVVSIIAEATTVLNISIDTGIR